MSLQALAAAKTKPKSPPGYTHFDSTRKQWYRNADDGLHTLHQYSNGKTISAGPGSYVRGMGGSYASLLPIAEAEYNARVKPQLNLYQAQLGMMQKNYQNAAGDVRSQYNDLNNVTQNTMGSIGQAQKDAQGQLQQIAQNRMNQIQSATPTYSGPLGQIAQNLADKERQSATDNAGADQAANQTYNVQTGLNRQALAGQLGLANQVGANRTLGEMGMQERAQEMPWNVNIADLKANRNANVIDALYSLANTQANQQRANLDVQSKAQQRLATANLDNQKAAHVGDKTAAGGGGGTTRTPKASNKTPYGMTFTQQSHFSTALDSGLRTAGPIKSALMKMNDAAGVQTIAKNAKISPIQAQVALELVKYGHVRPATLKTVHRLGYGIGNIHA